MSMTRRDFAILAAAALAARPAWAQDAGLITRSIPSTGERLPVVGLGTAQVFDNDSETTRAAATQVVQALVAGGGSLIDTSSVYADSELVLGQVIGTAVPRDKVFIATKLESPNADELKRSLARLRTPKLDLLQLHNVSDTGQSLGLFREWKAQGVCRYVGVTSTYHGAYPAVEAVLARERPDFVQIDYSLDDREAEKRVLPLAAEHKVAVLTALPFGRARLLRATKDKPLPDWAQPFAKSWAQFFLKWLLADPRVTAVIPGTNNAAHMTDNLGAMRGRLPNPDERKKMTDYVEAL